MASGSMAYSPVPIFQPTGWAPATWERSWKAPANTSAWRANSSLFAASTASGVMGAAGWVAALSAPVAPSLPACTSPSAVPSPCGVSTSSWAMTPTSPASSLPPVTTSVRVPRNTLSEPAVISSTMASASDTEAARPFPVPRLRLMRASMPPTPSTRPAAPRAFHSDEGAVHFAARAAPRRETRLPLAARSESMMFVRLARFAGIHTDTSTVTKVSTEATSSTQPFTATRKGTSTDPAS